MRKRRNILARIGTVCLALLVALGVMGVAYSAWSDKLTITGTVETGVWDVGGDCEGTNGFWNNWDKHNTYTRSEIEGWLSGIAGTSNWLNVTHTYQMDEIFNVATGGEATMEERFLAHYLATRLNAASGRLLLNTHRDFDSYDPYNYLGLGGIGTLKEIIGWGTAAGIESKYGTSDVEFETMKDICDALNNLEISPFP